MADLGKTQKSVLRCLREHGSWHVGCGWLWDTYSGTARVMDSLVKRGLATVEHGGTYHRAIYYPVKEVK
jgi:hypothetical protein